MRMGNLFTDHGQRTHMTPREAGVGIDHLTVVPTNAESQPNEDEEDDEE